MEKLINLKELIPPEEYELKMDYGFPELDCCFLCFEENYIPIMELVPKDYTIIDMGCYQAAQCYLFKNHAKYIGIDRFDMYNTPDYRPPLRFYTDNTSHASITNQKLIEFYKQSYWPFENKNTEKFYFIASACPDFEGTEKMFELCENMAIFYPGKQDMVKGINADKILSRHKELLDSREERHRRK